MKKVLIASGAVVVVVGAAAVLLPRLVPADRIRQEVVAQVKAATGRDLAIDGKVAVSIFPSLSVQVSNVALSNPPGYQGKDLMRLGALDVRLKLLPILSGKVEVDSFVLVDPVVSLEVDRQGRPNWAFGDKGAAQPKARESGGGGLQDVALGQVRIENGKFTYVDAKSGTREEADAVNLSVDLKSLDDPLKAKGGLKWRGKTIELTADVTRPRQLMEGGASPAELSVASEVVKLAFKGDATASSLKGDLNLSVPSVRGLLQWTTGKPLDLAGNGMGPFSVAGKLNAGGTRVALSQAEIGLDAIKAKGDLSVETGGARPALKGKLEVDGLDLTPYLPPEQPAKPSTAQAKSDWSDAPLDASALKSADADLALAVNGLVIRRIKVDKTALHIRLNGGRLDADLVQLALYQGTGKGRLSLDGSQSGLGLDAAFALSGLQAGPFLADAAAFDRLEGTGSADIQVSGRGKTERALVSSLGGKGAVTFLDGAVKGINLAEMVRNVSSAFTAGGGSQKTDFAELGGTFTMAGGILSNKDLALKSPLLRVEGAGTVELPPRSVHYRIEPKAVASLEGQGGRADLGGITVPVMVEGPWDHLSFRPDLQAMAKGQAGKALEGILGGNKLPASAPAGEQSGPLPINPGSLFGR